MQQKPYNRAGILSDLQGFEATSDGQKVVTTHSGRTLRSVQVSTQYRLFPFADYIAEVLETLETQMQPARYFMEIKQGVQEINILSEPFDVCGELYCKGFYILNSTDKTRALQFMAGLYRVASSTEIIMEINELTLSLLGHMNLGDGSSFVKVVHKGKSFEDKIEDMSEFIDRMGNLIAVQVRILEDLNNQRVSMKALLKHMLYQNAQYGVVGENAQIASASRVRTQGFVRQLMRGHDRLILDNTSVSGGDFYAMSTPLDFVQGTGEDVYVNAYQAFQCYMNVYRSRDTSVMRRESYRFTTYLEEVGTDYTPVPKAKGAKAKALPTRSVSPALELA